MLQHLAPAEKVGVDFKLLAVSLEDFVDVHALALPEFHLVLVDLLLPQWVLFFGKLLLNSICHARLFLLSLVVSSSLSIDTDIFPRILVFERFHQASNVFDAVIGVLDHVG